MSLQAHRVDRDPWRSASLVIVCGLAVLHGTVSRGSELVWEGTLSLELLHPAIPTAAVTGTGVASVVAVGGGVHLERLGLAGGAMGSQLLSVTAASAPTSLAAVHVGLALGSGSLAPFAPAASPSARQLDAARLPVFGFARLCLFFAGCGNAITLDLTAENGAAGLGIGGILTAGAFLEPRVSVQAAPWTVRSATVAVPTLSGGTFGVQRAGWLHGALSFTSSTAAVGGALSLVSPLAVTSEVGGLFASFGRVTLRFVPEPDPLLAIACGLAWVAWLAARRHPGTVPRSRR